MVIHLVKLCVGADSLDDLRRWTAGRRREAGKDDAPFRYPHITRMTPKRTTDLLDGGSLYWVIRGQVAARQTIVGVDTFVDSDGVGRCKVWLDGKVIAVSPRPMRAFQGWRYYDPKDAPPDLDEQRSGIAEMPEALRRELASLGLL